MRKVRLFLMSALVMGLTLGLAGMSYAATITCGQCHGAGSDATPTNADNCTNTARALHGVHQNYSSSITKKSTAMATKCGYCHTATATNAASLTHNNNYINVTSTATSPGMRWAKGTATCTSACHKTRANTAKWGNMTSASIKLACNACHDDSTNNASTALSGTHSGHVNNAATITGWAGVPMNSASNVGCNNCHPDQANDWQKVTNDNGSVKGYPHASDGTNVVGDNAALNGTLGASRAAGTNDTCATSCHPRSASAKWGDAMNCDMCHYWSATPTAAGNTGTGSLSIGHNVHFTAGKICTDCHGTAPVTAAHGGAYPIVATNATMSRTGMTWNVGPLTCTFTSNGVGCHGGSSTTPAWNSTGNKCGTCHYYPGAPSRDWSAVGNGHLVRYATGVATNTHLKDTASYSYTLDTYSTTVTSTAKCATCHKTSKTNHNNGTIEVVGNGNSQCNTNYSVTVTTSGSNVTCSDVKCHSGKVTPNWW